MRKECSDPKGDKESRAGGKRERKEKGKRAERRGKKGEMGRQR